MGNEGRAADGPIPVVRQRFLRRALRGAVRAGRCEMLRICNVRAGRGRDIGMTVAEAAPRRAARAASGRGPSIGDSRLIACRSRVVQSDARAISRRFAARCERLAIRGRRACAKADSPVNQKSPAATRPAPAAGLQAFAARGRAADGSPLACSSRTRRFPTRANAADGPGATATHPESGTTRSSGAPHGRAGAPNVCRFPLTSARLTARASAFIGRRRRHGGQQ